MAKCMLCGSEGSKLVYCSGLGMFTCKECKSDYLMANSTKCSKPKASWESMNLLLKEKKSGGSSSNGFAELTAEYLKNKKMWDNVIMSTDAYLTPSGKVSMFPTINGARLGQRIGDAVWDRNSRVVGYVGLDGTFLEPRY